MTDRLDRLRASMEEAELDAFFVGCAVDDIFGTHSANRRYLSGFSGSTGYVFITATDAVIVADFRYTEQAEQECVPRGLRVHKTEGAIGDWWPKLCAELGLGGKRVGLSRADTTLGLYTRLWDSIAEMPAEEAPQLMPAPGIVEELRAVKDVEELATLQGAIDIGDRALERVAANIDAAMTEIELARAVQQAVLEEGGEGIAFGTIAASGDAAARPHASPRDVPVGKGRTIVIDMGARLRGYCSDLTRTISAGPFPEEFKSIYEIVFEAQQTAIERVEAGMSGKDAHALAADVIDSYGYDEYFGHGLGHGVGLDVHEAPYLGKSSQDTLEDGMVFTIEPGIYLPGRGGVRIEDIVVLEQGRARVLSHAPKLSVRGAKP